MKIPVKHAVPEASEQVCMELKIHSSAVAEEQPES